MDSATSADDSGLEVEDQSTMVTPDMKSLVLDSADEAEIEYCTFVKTLVRYMKANSVANNVITAVFKQSVQIMKNNSQQTSLIESYVTKCE